MQVSPESRINIGAVIPAEVKAVQARLLQERSFQAPNDASCLRNKLINAAGGIGVLAVAYQILPTVAGGVTLVTHGDFFEGYKAVLGPEVGVTAVLGGFALAGAVAR